VDFENPAPNGRVFLALNNKNVIFITNYRLRPNQMRHLWLKSYESVAHSKVLFAINLYEMIEGNLTSLSH